MGNIFKSAQNPVEEPTQAPLHPIKKHLTLENPSTMETTNSRKTLFVFYKLTSNVFKAYWVYECPANWEYIASEKIHRPQTDYKYEDIFEGFGDNKEFMLYLNTLYTELIDEGIVEKYKISDSYSP